MNRWICSTQIFYAAQIISWENLLFPHLLYTQLKQYGTFVAVHNHKKKSTHLFFFLVNINITFCCHFFLSYLLILVLYLQTQYLVVFSPNFLNFFSHWYFLAKHLSVQLSLSTMLIFSRFLERKTKILFKSRKNTTIGLPN